MPDYKITVRRIGIKGVEGIKHREEYTGTQHEAERRASDVWSYHRFDSQPGRFRLKMHKKGDASACLTID